MTPKNKNRNKGKKGKVIYITEYGLTLPYCPFCNEPAYDDEYCVFCGAEFIKPTKEEMDEVKKANHEYKVIYKNVVLIQVGCSVYQYKDNKLWKGAGIVMRLISRKSEKDILKVKLYCISKAYEDEETYSFESKDGYLFLNYDDEIVLYFMPTNYGFLFQMKTVTCGTNSDNYFMGSVEIGFIGQLLEKGILEWELEQ